jgi:plasmid stabilization system protein ParE
MTYRVRVRSVALAEFAEATEWYSARSRGAAERFVMAVEATFDQLARAAHQCPVVHDDIRRVGIPGFPYTAYFRVREADCFVIALIHGRRNPRRWQHR